MLVYDIRLPKEKSPAAFGKFMRDEYFPAIHKGATRVGKVTELRLLRCESTQTKHKFLWLVGWSGLSQGGPHVDDERVGRKLDRFGATVKRLDAWEEVAAWDESQA
jgi:hypothetical protein